MFDEFVFSDKKQCVEDELKNRISMALKDSVLQQYFEIICKRLEDYEYLKNYLKDREDILLNESR